MLCFLFHHQTLRVCTTRFSVGFVVVWGGPGKSSWPKRTPS